MRHNTVGEGLDVTEAAVNGAFDKLRKLPQARIALPVLKKLESRRDGTDAVWSVDLGRSRQVAGLFGTLAPFLMVARSTDAVGRVELVEEVVEEEVEVVEPPPPPPPEPKPAGGGGGGR